MQWNETYGGTGWDEAASVVQSSDGGYVLAGRTDQQGYPDAWVVKVDSDGHSQWKKTYGGSNVDFAFSVIETSDLGYAFVGSTYSCGAGGSDAWFVKMNADAESNLAWTDCDVNTITLHRGAGDICWNYVRIQIYKQR